MSSGGKSGGAQSTLKDYYASWAAVFACGPAQDMAALYVDKEKAWPSFGYIDLTAVSNPYTFDTERGRVHMYQGTADQTLSDPVLTAPGRSFSAMRNRIVLVFENFYCGRERESVSDVQLAFARKPEQTVISGDAANLDTQKQANGLAFAAELLTSPVNGYGNPDSICDATTWQAAADKLYAERTLSYISPRIDTDTSFREFLSDLRGYNPLWFRQNAAGAIEVGLFPRGEEAPEGMVVITNADLEPGTQPSIESVTHGDLPTRFRLTWTNPELVYESAPARWENQLARGRRSRNKPATMRRPWVQRGDQANQLAAREGKYLSTEYYKVSGLSIRESKALDSGFKLGEPFALALEIDGVEYAFVALLLGMTGFGDGGGFVKIRCEEARGILPGAGWEDFVEAVFEDETDPEDLDYWHALQATEEMAGDDYRLFILAGRTDGLLSGYNVYFKGDASEYQILGQSRTWSVPVALVDDYAADEPVEDDSGNLKISRLDAPAPFGWDQLPTAMTEDEWLDDLLLLVVISTANPAAYEVMSVKAIGSPVSGEYPLQALRARLGTRRLGHSAGDRAYLVLKDNLTYFRHSQIALKGELDDAADRVVTLKLQPTNYRKTLDLEDATAKNLVIQDATLDTPTGFRVESIANGYAIFASVSERKIAGCRLWMADTPDGFTVDPTIIIPISIERRSVFNEPEAASYPIAFTYTDRQFAQVPKARYFKADFYDDSPLVRYTAEVGPVVSQVLSESSTPVVEVTAATQVFRIIPAFIGEPYGIRPQTITLTALVSGVDNPSYRWYYREKNGDKVYIDGETGPTYTTGPASSYLFNTSDDPHYKRLYGCEVANGAAYDEKTLFSCIQAAANKVALVLQNEVCTVLVDGNGDPLPVFVGEHGKTLCGTRMIRADVERDAVAASPSGAQYVLSVDPADPLTIVGLNAFYVDDFSALSLGENVFDITFDDGVDSYTVPYKVIVKTATYQPTQMVITADGPLEWEQPITPGTLTLTGRASRGGGDYLATRAFPIAITAGGFTTYDDTEDDESGILLEVENNDGRIRVVMTHESSGASAEIFVVIEPYNTPLREMRPRIGLLLTAGGDNGNLSLMTPRLGLLNGNGGDNGDLAAVTPRIGLLDGDGGDNGDLSEMVGLDLP